MFPYCLCTESNWQWPVAHMAHDTPIGLDLEKVCSHTPRSSRPRPFWYNTRWERLAQTLVDMTMETVDKDLEVEVTHEGPALLLSSVVLNWQLVSYPLPWFFPNILSTSQHRQGGIWIWPYGVTWHQQSTDHKSTGAQYLLFATLHHTYLRLPGQSHGNRMPWICLFHWIFSTFN